MITLELPNTKYKDSFIATIKECQPFLSEPKTPSNNWWKSWAKYDIDYLQNDFEEFVKDRLDIDNGFLAKRWNTQVHTYWLIRDGESIGQVEIRPNLDSPMLREAGGNIGMIMRPSVVGRGYAFHCIPQFKEVFKKLGLTKIMVSCDITNKASFKLISGVVKHFGGYQEEGIVSAEINGNAYQLYRFWVNVL